MNTYSLVDRTRDYLARRGDLSLEQIASGAQVGLSWLQKFNADRIPKPGVHPVQKVHDFLASVLDEQAA